MCIHGYVLWELRLLIAIKLCPWILSADIFIQNMTRSYFICNQKCISTFGFFLLLVEVKLSKYADIQFVESETVMNYISFSSVLWRISMLVKFIIYYLTKTYWRFTSNFQVITFPRRIKWWVLMLWHRDGITTTIFIFYGPIYMNIFSGLYSTGDILRIISRNLYQLPECMLQAIN